MRDSILHINSRQYQELENLASGTFSPVSGFMREDEFSSVVADMRLPNGDLFPLPVVLDVTAGEAKDAEQSRQVTLMLEGDKVGEIVPESVFTCSKLNVADQVYGTSDPNHPGVDHWLRMGSYFVGGPVKLTRRVDFQYSELDMGPEGTRAQFLRNGWRTVVGFQTRNVPHRAHEYLLRLALEQYDGLFIQPLIGAKKRGDFTPEAILTSYRTLLDGFLPRDRIQIGILSTAMRYAGPREAVLHAIIRRNYGCTHFIVGRDHAGVGEYYGKYDAQELAYRCGGELGIQILDYAGPFHCSLCDSIVTERTCPHVNEAPQFTREISGTDVRKILSSNDTVDPELMRPEIVESIQGTQILIEKDSE